MAKGKYEEYIGLCRGEVSANIELAFNKLDLCRQSAIWRQSKYISASSRDGTTDSPLKPNIKHHSAA